MKVKYLFAISLALFLHTNLLFAQEHQSPTNLSPKRELRGVWIATVANIDWPSEPGLTVAQQQEELLNLLNQHQKNGINAIFFQVRPAADALYKSTIEPWSYWLTGLQGQAPLPYYDPLEFIIKEAHQRGMELHAWFNPYRAINDTKLKTAPNHITRTHPQWTLKYGGKVQLDPGIPQVQDYIIKVIIDVVKRYDIDGVHFDDYFYPYPVAGQILNDKATFNKYGRSFSTIEDWRRDNVNRLVERLNREIHAEKYWVKFGISPFGIWKNKTQDPQGSDTHGLSNFYQLYADSKLWIQKGWVDYINPQLYFTRDYSAASFSILLNWWQQHLYGRHLYVGMAAYRINQPKNKSWRNKNEMPAQLQLIRNQQKPPQGAVYFSSKSLINNPLGFSDSLQNHYYKHPSLPPQMKWLDSIPPNEPQNIKVHHTNQAVQITWNTPKPSTDLEEVYGYVIYRFDAHEETNKNRPDKIIHISYNKNQHTFTDTQITKGKGYFYMITALDHLKNESEESIAVGINIE